MADTSLVPLGLVVPSTNTVVEREITGAARSAVTWHVTRVLQRETHDPQRKIGTVLAMQEELGSAVDRLAAIEPAAVGFACTAGSFLRGAEDDRDTCRDLSKALGAPFLTASTAVLLALRAVGASRVALVTPYIDEVNSREAAYLNEAGVEVTASSGLGIVGNLPKGRLPATASRDAVLAVDIGAADAVFVSCTNWLTFPVITELTERLGRPVISSNSALLWALIGRAGRTGSLLGLGALDGRPLPLEVGEPA